MEGREPPADAAAGERDARTSQLGLWILLLSLSVLFVAGMVGYVLIRLRAPDTVALDLPDVLWGSTAALLAAGWLLQRALVLARRRRPTYRIPFRLGLLAAFLFLGLQTPGLIELLSRHQDMRAQHMGLYGLVFFLVLLHAVHVVGGLVAWLVIARRGSPAGGRDDAGSLRLLTTYWHFLDGVWAVMFSLLLVLG
jgi:cytochrome c oxidase subunit 3